MIGQREHAAFPFWFWCGKCLFTKRWLWFNFLLGGPFEFGQSCACCFLLYTYFFNWRGLGLRMLERSKVSLLGIKLEWFGTLFRLFNLEIKATILREFIKCLFWKVMHMSFVIGGMLFASNRLVVVLWWKLSVPLSAACVHGLAVEKHWNQLIFLSCFEKT